MHAILDHTILNTYFNNGKDGDNYIPIFKDELKEDDSFNIKNIYFLYDSIRYQINSIGEVADEVTIIDDGKSMIWNGNKVTFSDGMLVKIIFSISPLYNPLATIIPYINAKKG